MSFAYDVKAELCRTEPKACCALAECYGVLLYCNAFSPSQIRVVTEHLPFARRLARQFWEVFGVRFAGVEPDGTGLEEEKPGKLILTIRDPAALQTIFAAFGYNAATSLSLHVNLGVLEEDCCKAAFLRGAFLAGGSVIDPGKRYHWELMTPHLTAGREVHALLLDMGFSPKTIQRTGGSVLYFKQSETIEDIITLMGAPVCAMNMMTVKLEKEVRNDVNRAVNCEIANVEKTVAAAQTQVDAIRALGERMNGLPDKLQQTARLRLEHPEATLQEMAELAGVSKSAMNHRLRKLIDLAAEQSAAEA